MAGTSHYSDGPSHKGGLKSGPPAPSTMGTRARCQKGGKAHCVWRAVPTPSVEPGPVFCSVHLRKPKPALPPPAQPSLNSRAATRSRALPTSFPRLASTLSFRIVIAPIAHVCAPRHPRIARLSVACRRGVYFFVSAAPRVLRLVPAAASSPQTRDRRPALALSLVSSSPPAASAALPARPAISETPSADAKKESKFEWRTEIPNRLVRSPRLAGPRSPPGKACIAAFPSFARLFAAPPGSPFPPTTGVSRARPFDRVRSCCQEIVAALTVLSHNETAELSLQQHLDLVPDLGAYNVQSATEADSEPLMMAQPVPHQATDKKRVKVYELRNNDWFDRGTGFCTATFATTDDGRKDPRVIVESEDQPDRLLLETKIQKEDGFQKQQETLIVWQEPGSGVDMALSFQEAEGCALIWRFVNNVQQTFHNNLAGADDGLSDDLAMEVPPTINLPAAELGNLHDIDTSMRIMSSTANGRDALAKFIMADDYIGKLIPLVEMAEDLESLPDLHRLCGIMKSIILLNDTTIIEHAVSDENVLGVVGALEYDPDFPSHKANHRHWLDNQGRYKEVVPIEDEQTRRRIHQTYRLQYLKDVVLARILDDPTFSVLNSLIFFNQVDIVQHLQGNGAFLNDLFGIFNTSNPDQKKKKEAVLFIQQCCAIAKTIQPPARQSLYNNFIAHGLLQVIHFGLRHSDVGVRVGATDILVSIIDHDAQMIRQTIYRQMHDNQPSLIDSLTELLLVEVDLGVKSQISEALKVLLDQGIQPQAAEAMAKANGEFMGRPRPQQSSDPQQELFLTRFYERSAMKLFKPLLDLENRDDMSFSVQQASMFSYLIEILSFFIRQHHRFSRYFVMNHNIAERVVHLVRCPEKYLKLVAIRFFRCLIGLQEEFYIKQITEKKVLGPILDVLIATMPRDNLLGSACLELFEYIKKENLKELVKHLVENYRDRLTDLSYMSTFREIVLRYDQTQGYTANMDYFLESEEDMTRRPPPNARLMEHIAVDPHEEEYWETSDPEDEGDEHRGETSEAAPTTNGSTPSKPLVDYASDEEADETAVGDEDKTMEDEGGETVNSTSTDEAASVAAAAEPPERLSEKRRREEDEDEDELGKLMANKRRNSSSSDANSVASNKIGQRRRSFTAGSGNGTPKKISISLSPAVKSGGNARSDDES